jgi:hypothetical protein
MHAARKRRHGSPDMTTWGSKIGTPETKLAWYEIAYMPNHPLAGRSGQVYVHRAVLYDAIGPGEHACNWCSEIVRWDAHRWAPDLLNADHLNSDPSNNSIDNLVPACRKCNSLRGQQRRHRQFVAAGFWSGVDTQTGRRKPEVTDVREIRRS